MIDDAWLIPRPVIVAIAGPNGAGKSTFFHAFLRQTGLSYVNADSLASELKVDAYSAAALAGQIRQSLFELRESFVFETVFSDPVGAKVAFLERAAAEGYTIVLCYIGLDDASRSIARVAMRVSQGGHDVPDEKLQQRFPRTLANLKRAIERLPVVLVYDNSDLANPYRLVAIFRNGKATENLTEAPGWLEELLR